MHEPQLQSPLHAFGLPALAKSADTSAGVWANEIPHLGYISLRGDAGDMAFVEAASRALGVALPVRPCAFVHVGALKVLWLSPDEWMIVCAHKHRDGLREKLSDALKGIRSQAVDNSGGFTQVLLQGRDVSALLSHTSVYNISALGSGRVIGTTLGKSSVYLHRQGDGYCLLLRRSFADYIWRFLVRAAEPYGFGVAGLPESVAGGGAK